MKTIYDGTQDLEEYDVIKFYADWCGPCKTYAPLFDKLAEHDKEKSYIEVNVDDHTDAVLKYKVRAVPTVIVGGKNKKDYVQWSQQRLTSTI